MDPRTAPDRSLRNWFEKAIALSPQERSDLLTDPDISLQIRQELKALLEADEGAETFLQQTVATARIFEPGIGERFGPYETCELLGRGGMGVVYKAERVDGELSQTAAIKVVKHAWLDPRSIERFRQERQTLAGLAHNNIARLLDGGTRPDGVSYLVMEYVDGLPIDQYCQRKRLSIGDRLRLFLPLCDALDYAHRKLVVHRDLKPSNVMVTAAGEPKLLDFGIAKTLDATAGGATTATLLLTPEFASPEQALNGEITTATDVYGLGAVLYFLLTDVSPHSLADRSPVEVQRAICQEAPPRPSALRPQLRGDLENILLKALQVEPARRYASAHELADDIERYLEQRPVRATPDGWAYRARRFTRRHLYGVLASVALVIALASGLGVALWEERAATREAQTSRAVQAFLENIFRANTSDQSDPVKARGTTARELLDIGARKIDGELKEAPEAKLQVLSTLAEMYYDLGLDDEAVKFYRKRVDLAKSLQGERGPMVARALVDLGASMHSSSFVNERESVLNEAKDLLDQQRDFDSETRGRLLRALAEEYESTDKTKGVAFAHQSVDFYRRNPSPEGLVQALYLEAILRSDRSEVKLALPLLAEMITLSKKTEGDPNPDLPRAYAYQGEANQELLRLREAEQSLRNAYNVARRLNGDAHVDTLQTGMRLGGFLARWAHEREGLGYLEEAKDTALKIRGAADPFHTPQALFEYGSALLNDGQIEDGLRYITQAVKNRRKNRPGTIYLAQMLEIEGSALIELGDFIGAQKLLDEAAAIRGKVDDQSDRVNIGVRVKLLLATGKPEDARRLIELSYGREPETAEISRTSLRVLRDRVAAAAAGSDAKTAIALADKIRKELAASAEELYLKEWEASLELYEGEAYLQLGRPLQALPLLQQAMEFRTELLDPNAPAVAEALIGLAECHLHLGNRDKARQLRDRARRIIAAHRRLGRQYTAPLGLLEKQLL